MRSQLLGLSGIDRRLLTRSYTPTEPYAGVRSPSRTYRVSVTGYDGDHRPIDHVEARARLQRGDEEVRPARDQSATSSAPRVDVAEQPLRAGRRARPQPVAHIHRQPDPPIAPAWRQAAPANEKRSRAIYRSGRLVESRHRAAPWPRRCSGSSDSAASTRTGRRAHSTERPSSNSASARAARHRYNSLRKASSKPRTPRPRPASAPGLGHAILYVDVRPPPSSSSNSEEPEGWITRWPSHVTATRRARTGVPDQAGQTEVKRQAKFAPGSHGAG